MPSCVTDHVLVADAKYTDGVLFFDGEKKPGSYLAVPYAVGHAPIRPLEAKPEEEEDEEEDEEEGEEGGEGGKKEKEEVHLPLVAGILCGDTFESYDDQGERSELKDTDLPLFRTASLVLGEQLAAARLRVLSLQRQQALQRLQAACEDEGADLHAVVAQAVRALRVGLASEWKVMLVSTETADRMRCVDFGSGEQAVGSYCLRNMSELEGAHSFDADGLTCLCRLTRQALATCQPQFARNDSVLYPRTVQVALPVLRAEAGQQPAQEAPSGVLYLYKSDLVTHQSLEFDDMTKDFASEVSHCLARAMRPPLEAIGRAIGVQAHQAVGAGTDEGDQVWQRVQQLACCYSSIPEGVSCSVALVLPGDDTGLQVVAAQSQAGSAAPWVLGERLSQESAPLAFQALLGVAASEPSKTFCQDKDVCVPLLGADKKPFGVLNVRNSKAEGEVYVRESGDREVVGALGAAAGPAFALVEYRRKLATVLEGSLQGLLRKTAMRLACVSFPDLGSSHVLIAAASNAKACSQPDAPILSLAPGQRIANSDLSVLAVERVCVGDTVVAYLAGDRSSAESASSDRFATPAREELTDLARLLSRVAAQVYKEGVNPQRFATAEKAPPDATPQVPAPAPCAQGALSACARVVLLASRTASSVRGRLTQAEAGGDPRV